MRPPATDREEPSGGARALVEALGLAPASDALVEESRRAALAASAALWPAAAAVLLLAPLALVLLALGTPAATALAWRTAPAVLLALGCWAVAAHPRAAASPTQWRLATIAAGASAIALSLALGAEAAAALPRALHPAAAVAGGAATVALALALQPLRAATLALVATLALAALALTGAAPLPAALALGAAALVALAVTRAALVRQRALGERRARREIERRDSRLVAEYEAHGTGWFWQSDRRGRLTYLSDKVARELRALGIEPIGAPLTDVFRVDSAWVETERTLSFHLSSRTSFTDYSVRPAAGGSGAERWWSISGRPARDDLDRFQGFIGAGSDLTEQRRAEAEIKRLALFDALTGIANRQRMRLALEQTLAQAQAGGTHPTGLFLLDLDRFKAVNDTLGHQVGDELLKEVAQRLQRTIGDAGLVGRLGGDEFKVIVPNEGDRDRLAALAQRVIAALSLPYHIDRSTLSIGCSVGVAIAPADGAAQEELVRNADLALYAAKADGRGVHRFYREELLHGAQNRKRLEDDLRQALAAGQFHLAYQPVVSTADTRIMGYEALVRWDHPQRGPVSPAEFIPVAEECGLIEAIGAWVLETACAEAASWPDHVRVAVNVSPIQFANPQLPALVTRALAASGLAPARLELEITEGVFLNEDASSERMFRALKALGVRLALDDFGTGYSSLGYLRKAPFDKIKIDQSFVRGAIQPGNRNAAIIRAIVSLAETLGMETTAEGVEQQDEIVLIRGLGCSHIQGYVYGRPARADDVRAQLAAAEGYAVPIGHKTSRAARHRVLRSARIELAGERAEVRVRNISAAGAMVDGVDLPAAAIGYPVALELEDGLALAATIRWVDDEGRAGLEFAAAFDLDRLNQPAPRRAA
ncbi:EAL domain-containing protein [Sphingomonas sp. RHCKR7]|uniref:EAL domain-containing protein n=1 Tax=Sphingomonas folli TaxID=2862497 RepID=UPI001CA4C0CE|nr:EAL domain-containing protein [Sphingomonas folli]MBW6527324.1 EAL domain-containing protein [Sphingomonas folli]